MSFNHKGNGIIQTNDGTKLENDTDFKFIGALIESSEEDVEVRKVAAWRVCSKLKSGSPHYKGVPNNDCWLRL